jgi:hypothetical protein
MQELYISVDIESDGPLPGPNSMLSLGAVALLRDGREVGQFEINFELLEGATPNPATMEWWSKQPREVWDHVRRSPKPPEEAMRSFVTWVKKMSDQQGLPPTCVAYPAGFDFLFVYWYLIRFASESPFSFSCLDIKSYAAATLNVPYRQATKKNMPKSWFKNLPPHTHKGLDDAREQGLLYLNIVKHRESQG